MGNKKFWSDWLFPIISLVTFASLLGAMLVEMNSISLGDLLSYSSGLLAYTMMLTVTFMGSRPRFFEKKFGMPEMYEIHAIISVVLSILTGIHVIIQWNGFQWVNEMSLISQTGWVAVLSLIVVMFTGIFSISGIFVDNNKAFRNFKNKLNREVNLWLHRLAIVAIIAVYLHMWYFPVLKNNFPFMLMMTSYTVATLGYYLYWKFKIVTSTEYKVAKIYKATPSLWVVEFEPVVGTMEVYRPGDYFFIRFKGDADITKEGHPFSTSSAMTTQFSNSIEFMIKEAGDWTESLANIKVGDVATFEGPYGNYLPEEVEATHEDEVPYILLGGGIGLTPNLSVLRHEVENNSQREIHLFWGLAYKEDMFMLDELEAAKEQNPNFHYHLVFSNEEVEGHRFGFIDHDFLEEVGADHYRDGHFFVCGPGPMLDGMRKMLADGNVPYDQIHLDDFGF